MRQLNDDFIRRVNRPDWERERGNEMTSTWRQPFKKTKVRHVADGEMQRASTRRLRASLLAVSIALSTVVTIASPASAHAGWYTKCWSEPFTIAPALCTEWTGGWPSGMVRAETFGYYHQTLYLQVCAGCNGPYNWNWTVAAQATTVNGVRPRVTPSVKAGKYNSYRVCAKRFAGGSMVCMPSYAGVYLGD